MSNKKNKGNSNAPPNLNAKFSDHKLALSNEYKTDKAIQKDAVKSYLEMRPLPYARVFNDLFKASNFTLALFHILSSVLCFPLMFSLVWQYVLRNQKSDLKPLIDAVFTDPASMLNLSFILTLSITLIVVGLLEYWQHKTLKSCFKIHYQNSHTLPFSLVVIALMFSLVSIGSSGYGAFEVVEVSQTVDPALINNYDVQIADAMRSRKATNSRNSELLLSKDRELEYLRQQRQALFDSSEGQAQKYSYILLILSLVIETMIFYTTRSIFAYMYRTMQDVLMFNDLGNGQNFLNLNVAELTNYATTLPQYNTDQNTEKEPVTPPHRAPSNQKINIVELAKNKGTGTSNNARGKAAILIQEPSNENVLQSELPEQPEKLVHTKEVTQTSTSKKKAKTSSKKQVTGDNFTHEKLNRYLKIYKGKVKKSGTPETEKKNQIKVNYIQYRLSNFDKDQTDGFVKFSIKDALKWHKENRANLA